VNRGKLVDESSDPRRTLARRLRELREERWSDRKITQTQLARGLGGDQPLSVPLISSWESTSNPKIPPMHRLEAIATFYCAARPPAADGLRLPDQDNLTDAERRAKEDLMKELTHLRAGALRAAGTGEGRSAIESLDSGPWYFPDGAPVTIVCGRVPDAKLKAMPYSDPADPDYIALYSYADLDALFELHGHIRAANPASQVNMRAANQLAPDDYTAHLVSLGGVDWNHATLSVLSRLQLPVVQVSDWAGEEAPYFEVTEGSQPARFQPRLEQRGERPFLREDVALFARAVNPYNRRRTVTVCNGMYGSGTFGAVRALTDAVFRQRNADYVQARFGDSESYCLLTRVTVESGAALTPDWTIPDTLLFEWPSR
jgi:transcriptional regulator with XRE-family HTH domain